MKNLPRCFCIIWLMVHAVGVSAAVMPGRWEKVSTLGPGTRVKVQLHSGEVIEGVLRHVQDSHLTLATKRAEVFPIRKQDVASIARYVEDSKLNGRLIGAGAGFGVGFLSVVAFEKSVTASGFRLEEENLSLAILGGAIGAGLGALTGHFLDGAQRKEELLYRVPSGPR